MKLLPNRLQLTTNLYHLAKDYVDKVPGAFFFLASGRKDNDTMIHESNFDFNDNLIEDATEFWMRLALNRFGLKYL